jgi:hypothetical protein
MAELSVPFWLGADPGGASAFGLASISIFGEVNTACVSCANEAVKWVI